MAWAAIGSKYYVPRLTFGQVRRCLAKHPAVIVPVAPMEPFGSTGALGAAAACCTSIADRLSSATDVLLAAPLYYAHATPLRAFAGCCGLKAHQVERAVAGIASDFIAQGCTSVFLLDGGTDSGEILDGAAKRVRSSPGGGEVVVVRWLDLGGVREIIDKAGGVSPRMEFAVLSAAAAVDPSLIRPVLTEAAKQGGPESYRTWRRRGKDPEKFRKLFPDGLTTPGPFTPDAELGARLIDAAVGGAMEIVAGGKSTPAGNRSNI